MRGLEPMVWADEILTRFPEKRVIVAAHSYMYDDDSRIGEGDLYNPHKNDASWRWARVRSGGRNGKKA
jgi:hypothetical protein